MPRLDRYSLPRLLALAAGLLVSLATATGQSRPPNVVFLLADDLGYGDLGSYGQEKIRTPNLDRLAAQGMRFTRHYSGSPVCAPARCVLMTGTHPGHAYIRSNRELTPAEGQHPIPAETTTLGELLQAQGYVTGAFGKWGLGGPGTEGEPLRQGFDRFYGYNCQREAHTYYPPHLWDDQHKVLLNNPEVPRHEDLPEGLDPNDPASYARYRGVEYAPDLYSEQALRFIRENRERPFFLFYPTIVPHVGLQVPEDSLQEYAGKWEDPPYSAGRRYVPNFTPRAAYAAMITRMDREIGRIVALIGELGLEEETVFIFTSDNGATKGSGGSDADFFRSNGNLRGYKTSIYEGGIRVPLIVKWKDRVAARASSDRITGFEDWMPTLLELIGSSEATPAGIDGISFAPTLLGKRQSDRPFLYREYPSYGGQQALILGDWKAVRVGLTGRDPNLQLELYNLRQDQTESTDVSSQHPDLVATMERMMREQRVPSPLFPIPVLDQLSSGSH